MSVRYALLGLLSQQPRHGYELGTAFETLVGGKDIWEVKPAQIYTTLARLAESGLVVVEAVEKEGGPEKRIYAVTETGRAELQAWFDSGVLDDHQRDEVFVKLMLSLAGVSDPTHVLQVQRMTLYRELHRVTAQRQQANPKAELAYILLLDKAVMHLEADLRWLDMIEARLEEVKRQPPPAPEPKPRGRPKK
jgi:DNA-binding PadR family transcriptional regulator